MKPRSAKAKGRRAQQELQQLILENFSELEPDDVKPAIMGESGTDIKLSPAARKLLPYSFEVKNVEKLNIWSALEQAEENCKDQTKPALVFKRNRSKTYIAMEIDEFFRLVKENGSS